MDTNKIMVTVINVDLNKNNKIKTDILDLTIDLVSQEKLNISTKTYAKLLCRFLPFYENVIRTKTLALFQEIYSNIGNELWSMIEISEKDKEFLEENLCADDEEEDEEREGEEEEDDEEGNEENNNEIGNENEINKNEINVGDKKENSDKPDNELTLEQLCVRYSMPEAIASLWKEAYGEQKVRSLLPAMMAPRPVCIRMDRRRSEEERGEVLKRLRETRRGPRSAFQPFPNRRPSPPANRAVSTKAQED